MLKACLSEPAIATRRNHRSKGRTDADVDLEGAGLVNEKPASSEIAGVGAETGASHFLLSVASVLPFVFWAIAVVGAFIARPPTAPIELEILSSAWHMSLARSPVALVNGAAMPEIPPLQYWLILAGWKLFGVTEVWPRLMSALASLAAIILIGGTARTLWPHRGTTPHFARIILAGLGGFVLTSSMIAPEILALPVALAGFRAIARLRTNPAAGFVQRVLLWAVFAAALVADVFLVGWSALALLPLIGLFSPHVADAVSDTGTAFSSALSGWKLWRWRVAVVVLSGAAAALAWFWYHGIAGGGRTLFDFGNGWNDESTEATRQESWTLVFVPLMLYPWICWKTLWRAFARQTRDGYGFGFRLSILYLFAAVLSGFVSGFQLQGMLPIAAPLALLGARLLANQAIKPKDFHAVLPGFLALMLGLFFFLMNMIPTAHLDALWRQLFNVPLPIWLGGSGLASGILLFVGGYALAQLSPSQQLSRTLQVACIPILLITCVNIEFANSLRDFFDLKPTATRMRELQDAGQEIAVYGPYRGEFDYYGRLSKSPAVLRTKSDAMAWAKAHPRGAIVSRFDGSALDLPALPYYRGVARDRWVAIWPTSAVLDTKGSVLATDFQ
jgi:4-amino-4-deoxy-L-arabinose transferase-like glycosyltransferase